MFATSQGLSEAPPSPLVSPKWSNRMLRGSPKAKVPSLAKRTELQYAIDTSKIPPFPDLRSPSHQDSLSPLRNILISPSYDLKSRSVLAVHTKSRLKAPTPRVKPILDRSITRVADHLPRLPRRHLTYKMPTEDHTDSTDLSDELISKSKFNEFVKRSYSVTKKIKRPPKLTLRELKNLEETHRKRDELKAKMQAMNLSREAKFSEIVDRVRHDFGLKDDSEESQAKFNFFDRCLD